MKINIITRHSVPNYGSILQTYSTQKALEKMGYDSEIIDYIKLEETNKRAVATNYGSNKSGIKEKIKKVIYIILQRPNVTKMNNAFKKFRKKYLKETIREYNSIEELSNNLPEADVYCTGSDQVWGKIGTEEYDKAYFLNFVPENKKCIAYAASFGVDKLPEKLNEDIKDLLKKYETILVRENTAEKIIREKGFDNVGQVLDPTLLLKKEEWDEICEPTKLDNKEYILVYQLHHNKEMEKYVKNLKKHTKLPIYRVNTSIYYGLKPGKFIYLPTPGQFVSYIKNAKYVVTDSFHGTVFSMIFQKQFIDILPGKTATRIESILKLVGLSNRILRDNNDYSFLKDNIDFTQVNNILENERNKSIEKFDKAIKNKKKNIKEMKLYSKCTGCRCCEQICPTGAIEIIKNSEGFIEPRVNEDKCTSCGLCLNKCPQLKELKIEKFEQKGYAVQNKDKTELLNSSSGGMFSLLAKEILKKEGIVYGAAYSEKLKVEHIEITKESELYKLRGSKYVQSDTKNTYRYVKDKLELGKYVLYSGTPCQIAGLRSFLNKEYEKLYTVDLICHGVPSPELFEKYKENLEEKQNSTIMNLNFRYKSKKGWLYKFLRIQYNNNKTKQKVYFLDSYYKSFLNGDLNRNCCYECKYSNLKRISDITIGDFWGIENIENDFIIKDGISAVLVNNEKGKNIFESCKNNMLYKEVKVEELAKENMNLNRPTIKTKIRDSIYKEFNNKDYNRYEKENLHFKVEIKHILKYLIPVGLKNNIKKLLKR